MQCLGVRAMQGVYWSAVTAVCLGMAGVFGHDITNGNEAKPHSRPYMARLLIHTETGTVGCGGFLILPNFILTAAHCNEGSITALLGAHDLTKEENFRQKIPVQMHIPHENYTKAVKENDIMLLKLNHSADMDTPHVKLIRLAQKGEIIPPDAPCSVAGWGRTSSNGTASSVLREANVSIQNQCVSPLQICARGSGSKGTCFGDSGGPLVCLISSFAAVGIVSTSDTSNCEDPHHLDIYTKLSVYSDWIENKISSSSSA